MSRDYLMGGEPDVVIQVLDATNLGAQPLSRAAGHRDRPAVVVALNMADLVEKNGDKIDIAALRRAWVVRS